jgi:hypothetical protein
MAERILGRMNGEERMDREHRVNERAKEVSNSRK